MLMLHGRLGLGLPMFRHWEEAVRTVWGGRREGGAGGGGGFEGGVPALCSPYAYGWRPWQVQ